MDGIIMRKAASDKASTIDPDSSFLSRLRDPTTA